MIWIRAPSFTDIRSRISSGTVVGGGAVFSSICLTIGSASLFLSRLAYHWDRMIHAIRPNRNRKGIVIENSSQSSNPNICSKIEHPAMQAICTSTAKALVLAWYVTYIVHTKDNIPLRRTMRWKVSYRSKWCSTEDRHKELIMRIWIAMAKSNNRLPSPLCNMHVVIGCSCMMSLVS